MVNFLSRRFRTWRETKKRSRPENLAEAHACERFNSFRTGYWIYWQLVVLTGHRCLRNGFTSTRMTSWQRTTTKLKLNPIKSFQDIRRGSGVATISKRWCKWPVTAVCRRKKLESSMVCHATLCSWLVIDRKMNSKCEIACLLALIGSWWFLHVLALHTVYSIPQYTVGRLFFQFPSTT